MRSVLPIRFVRSLSRFAAFVFILSFLVSPASPEKINDIHPTGYVTDLAGVLSSESKSRLEALCTELEQKTGSQLAIVTVNSLEGEDAAQYGNELFKQLGIGGKKDDRGVLLLVAPSEHKYWTEVGYGLEPVINDARAGDAGRAMVPFLRQGNYNDGIETAARQLANYIAADRGVSLSGAPPRRPARPRERPDLPHIPFWLILLLLFLGLRFFASLFGRSGRGGPRGGGWIGPIAGGMLGGMMGGGWRGGSGERGGGSGGWGGSSGGFGGFGGGSSGGGGAGGSW